MHNWDPLCPYTEQPLGERDVSYRNMTSKADCTVSMRTEWPVGHVQTCQSEHCIPAEVRGHTQMFSMLFIPICVLEGLDTTELYNLRILPHRILALQEGNWFGHPEDGWREGGGTERLVNLEYTTAREQRVKLSHTNCFASEMMVAMVALGSSYWV